MKFKKLMFLPLMAIALNSCSGDDSSDPVTEPANNFAMTAKINGTQYNMNNPFNTNTATESSFTQYPDATHLHLQGWPTGVALGGGREITIYISRENLSPGTYEIQTPDNPNAPNQIDLIDNTNDEFEDTIDGSLTITSVNTVTRTVTGTFEFKTSDDQWAENPVMNYNITDGTFNYIYDTEDID